MLNAPDDPADLVELRRLLREEHAPASLAQEILVEDMAYCLWRARRLQAALAAADPTDLEATAKLQDLVTSATENYRLALQSFTMVRDLRAARS